MSSTREIIDKIAEISENEGYLNRKMENRVYNLDTDGDIKYMQVINHHDVVLMFSTVVVNGEFVMGRENAYKALANVNTNLVFGHYDVDTDSNRVLFTNVIMCWEIKDLDPDEVSFNIELGFNMAKSFEEAMIGTGMLSTP